MAHHNETSFTERLYSVMHGTFHFNTFYTCLNKPTRVPDSFFIRDLIGEVRHITHKKGSISSSPNCFGMSNHIIHGNRNGCFMTECGHPQGISYKDDVDSRLVCQSARINSRR